MLSITHRHSIPLPSPRVHHRCEVNIECQQVLRRPVPNRVPADDTDILGRHLDALGDALEDVSHRRRTQTRANPLWDRPQLGPPPRPRRCARGFDVTAVDADGAKGISCRQTKLVEHRMARWPLMRLLVETFADSPDGPL